MTAEQKDALVKAKDRDAIISRSLTGKRNRLLRSGWTEAWEKPDAPTPLPLPLQDLVAGEAVTRKQIAEHVWDIDFSTDTNVVDVVVRRLRSKVDDPFKKKLVHTIRGVGYVLKAG